MSKQRHRRRSQGGTSPETTPQTASEVAHFSVSEVVQFWMSVDIAERHGVSAQFGAELLADPAVIRGRAASGGGLGYH
jgi:hypothetical protein